MAKISRHHNGCRLSEFSRKATEYLINNKIDELAGLAQEKLSGCTCYDNSIYEEWEISLPSRWNRLRTEYVRGIDSSESEKELNKITHSYLQLIWKLERYQDSQAADSCTCCTCRNLPENPITDNEESEESAISVEPADKSNAKDGRVRNDLQGLSEAPIPANEDGEEFTTSEEQVVKPSVKYMRVRYDRSKIYEKFAERFREKKENQQYIQHFFLLANEERDYPKHIIQRLVYEKFRGSKNKDSGFSEPILDYPEHIRKGEPDPVIFKAIGSKTEFLEESVKELCTEMFGIDLRTSDTKQLKSFTEIIEKEPVFLNKEVVVRVWEVNTLDWNKKIEQALDWFIKDFCCDPSHRNQHPTFIFFYIVQTPNTLPWYNPESFRYHRLKKRGAMFFSKLADQRENCTLLPQPGHVTFGDLIQWLEKFFDSGDTYVKRKIIARIRQSLKKEGIFSTSKKEGSPIPIDHFNRLLREQLIPVCIGEIDVDNYLNNQV